MKILIVAPTEREYRAMEQTLSHSITRHNYSLICCGIGKAAAAAAVATKLAGEEFDAVAVIGFAAGSLGFRQGDIVAPNVAIYHDCDVPAGFIPELTDARLLAGQDSVTVFTGDSFVNARSVAEIRDRFGVEKAIFDMEITAVAIAVGDRVKVLAVKMISDVPEDGHTEFSYEEFAATHYDFSGILAKIEQTL